MNTILWIMQLLLAAVFLTVGSLKVTQPIDKLFKIGLKWTPRFPPTTVKFIGTMEVLGTIGLIVPWLLDILPVLTPLAALGLTTIMVFASFHHLKHKEWKAIMLNLLLMVLALFVAWGRFTDLN